jgi:exonuclease-1
MGIKGLIPLLDPITQEMHIREYAGKTVAVDGNCWLHRGALG